MANKNFVEDEISNHGLRYKDKVVLVTGGARGIGRGCVEVFVKNGAKVAFCDILEREGKVFEEEQRLVGEAMFIPCDVTNEEQIKMVVKKTTESFGRLDCLINNAGSHPDIKMIDDFTAEDFRQLLNINLVSYFLFCKHALPHLRSSHGSIVNVSSMVGQYGASGSVTYGATKGAILAMTKSLAVDEAVHGVRVNSISPSTIKTPMLDFFLNQSENPQDATKAAADLQTLGRMGTPEECGEACLFLAAEGSFCTGVDILLSGGAELGYGHKSQTGNVGKGYFA
ncbi:17-beta-hydroxysteroid dehydrogenase 14 isoform X1 [Lingula anatina]|uniref:17-beta-hydroxysteroid dehydrogenase 14 isoform X1 n=1 Tax=Lingula anatina TaxID=7574 RepID=A0A1S3K1S3_LINAN|nr:17-beta-hydroxysteroid dehydrogenase 14 isoform X1 [Lingula anatina]XP_013416476.1 17-beta-hydroxysteroid dehydrogenase 14 isoform X2 [Lingula anatina]XP_013416477.1 17-beta-hydroxysteroid dehydrogenase 14 isoform X1 [Lingula anatina]|eukprot:XP_013416475.1 17-beta-hydroxysteroid dehydrogenase 14 isoform X1 [Lingula anatina]